MHIVDIRLWAIYVCPNCPSSTDDKTKYVVIVSRDGNKLYGFFINTKIHLINQRHPKRLAAQVEIESSECPSVLKKDISYIDCVQLKEWYAYDFSKLACKLQDQTIENILKAIEHNLSPDEISHIKYQRSQKL